MFEDVAPRIRRRAPGRESGDEQARQNVRVGLDGGGSRGIEPGERVVVRGLETLTDGTRVRVSGA